MISLSVRFNSRNAALNAVRALLRDPTIGTIVTGSDGTPYEKPIPRDGWYTPTTGPNTGVPTYYNMEDIGDVEGDYWIGMLYRGEEADLPANFLSNKRVQDFQVWG